MNQKNRSEAINKLETMVNQKYSNITGINVLKGGEAVYEKYFNNYTAADPIHVASVTKSIFSALIGIAIEKGYIKNTEQKIIDFFPDDTVRQDEKTFQNITVKDMITMTAPYKYETEPYEEFFSSENWMEFAFDCLGGDGPIGEFHYSAIVGTHILSGILTKVTGQSVFNFAKENLFVPLGIEVKDHVILHNKEEHMAFFQGKGTSGWAADMQGINPAGWGLTLTAGDMAKIGQLYLNRGVWNTKQIIPAGWIDESTQIHSRWGELSYGYLWWIIDGSKRSYAAMGDGGNVIYINTQNEIVVSIAAIFKPDVYDRIELIQEQIEPVFENCL